jgi:hypothetical protein
MFPRLFSFFLILLSVLSMCASTVFAQQGILPQRIRLDLTSGANGIRRSTIREVLEDYSFEDLMPYLESDYQPVRISILEEMGHRPNLLHDRREMVFELIDDRNIEVAKHAMSLSARELYHDDFTQKLEKRFSQLLDHEKFEIALKALTLCVDYGLHPAAVVKKIMELMDDEKFQKTEFYSNFINLPGFPIKGILHERKGILDIGLKEVVSNHPEKRELAIQILQSVTVDNPDDWVKIFHKLDGLPESQASEIVLSRLGDSLFRKLMKQHPALEQKLEKHLKPLVQSHPEDVAFYRIRQVEPSENIGPCLEKLSTHSVRSIAPFLEQRDFLPAGTTLYLRREIFEKAPELIPIWKELHPNFAVRLDKVFDYQPLDPKEFGDFPNILFSQFDELTSRLPESELPFLQKMFEVNKPNVYLDAIILLFHMGLKKYEPPTFHPFVNSPLITEVEQALSQELDYSPRVIAFLERLLKHQNNGVRLHALVMLMCSGQRPTADHCRILHSFLEKALTQKKFYITVCWLAVDQQ